LKGAPLFWTPVLEHKRFRGKQPTGMATVVDLSLVGAGVRAGYDPRISIGTQVLIAAGGGWGIAEVRRINAYDDPHEAFYGIHFGHLDAWLLGLFNDTLVARGPEQDASGAP